LYLVIISNLTHLQDGNTKVKFKLRTLEKLHERSLTEKYDQDPTKIIPDPQHWFYLSDLEPPDARTELLLLVGVELGQFVLPGLQLLVVVREVSGK
jgi:hypothetical protein